MKRTNFIKNRGQSTMEYVILLAGIVLFLVIFLGRNGYFFQQVNYTYRNVTSEMSTVATRFVGSHVSSNPTNTDGGGGNNGGGNNGQPVSPINPNPGIIAQ